MQFQRNTSIGKYNSVIKFLIKIVLVLLLIFFVIILLNKIDFPSPNKEIEKTIPNENLKIVK
jgi:large-conductance mechanosensitive channel|tara:strand:+ start:1602 stop:1787 length:186 start_codon:yes stop_codon:yes gene_type:complete